MDTKPTKVLFIFPYPLGKAASQRFRFEQYFKFLNQHQIEYESKPFLSDKTWNILYLPGRFVEKTLAILKGLFSRFLLLFRLKEYDYLFIHREATPVGPAFFEYFASQWLKKKIIYDFDDAIWIPNSSESNRFFSFLKGYSNVKHICRWAYKVSCGNDFLVQFAKQYNNQVVYNPTTIDTENHHQFIKNQTEKPLIIGWTGSHSTIRYIYQVYPVIQKLAQKHDFIFRIISDLPPDETIAQLEFVKWKKETEIEDLLKLNVGIMPLENDKWSSGKCGFKALQYMALGIPAVVSPVGVNTKIVDHSINGFICETEQEWFDALDKLLSDEALRINMAKQTRSKIELNYSVHSNETNFLGLFN